VGRRRRARGAAGYAESTIYQIVDVVAVEEGEEAGFPWASFEIVRLPAGKTALRVVPHGPPLAPSLTRPPFSAAELGTTPPDGAIEALDFARLKASVGRQ
jgi:hypothetical protein